MTFQLVVQGPRIRCAICDKPVDMVESWEDRIKDAVLIRAHCHGETDTMTITAENYMRLGQDGMDAMAAQEGVAFAQPAITGGAS